MRQIAVAACVVALLSVLWASIQAADPATQIQATVDLFGPEPRAWEALRGWNTPDYGWPGSALTASTRSIWWTAGLARVVAARWLVVWNPQGSAQSAIRLVSFGDLDDVHVLAEVTSDGAVTEPRGVGVWVTDGLQAMRDRNDWYIGHQLRGDPIIFQSTLELMWEP